MLYMGEIVCNIIYIVVLYPVNAVLYAIYQHILIIYLAHKIHDVCIHNSCKLFVLLSLLCKRKMRNFIVYYFVKNFLYIILFIHFLNKYQGRQH